MGDAVTAVETAVGAALDRLAPGAPLGVAVSGGGDSMALLAITAGWAKPRGHEIHVATVDHGLRPESAGEAAAVAGFAAQMGVPHRTLTIGTLPEAGNLPANARAARYAALTGWAVAEGLGAVLLGHTMDDQAETLLMRLARGSGAEGLSAMAEARRWDGVLWLRPLLSQRRAVLRDWLSARQIAWIDDPTNEDPAFDRIKARRALDALAPLGITVGGLAATAGRLARDRLLLREVIDAHARREVRWGAFGEARLAIDDGEPGGASAAGREIAIRLLGETIQRIGGGAYRPRFRSVEALYGRIAAPGFAGANLGGCLIRPAPEGVLVCREPAAVETRAPMDGRALLWDGRWKVSVERAGALTIGPVDAAARAALKAAADAGAWVPPAAWTAAPAQVREALPALWRGDGTEASDLLAVPHAGYFAPGAPEFGRIRIENIRIDA